jgi:Tfp pilus assembly protein PilO
MPFSIDVDGPYFSVVDFFGRLSGLSRIINVGDLTFNGLSATSKPRFPVRPNTTIAGNVVVTTFFTMSSDGQPASAQATPAAAKK